MCLYKWDCSHYVICFTIQRLIERDILQVNTSYSSAPDNLLQGADGNKENYNVHDTMQRRAWAESFLHCEISGSHGAKYENGSLLGYCTVQSGRRWPTSSP
jgi:hypothetical protein